MIAKYLDKAIPFGLGYRTEAAALGVGAIFFSWWMFIADYHAWINNYLLPILHEGGPYAAVLLLAARLERMKK